MIHIAIVRQDNRDYLFEAPPTEFLYAGQEVACGTKRGITRGKLHYDSLLVDDNTALLIGKLLNANFPLRKLVGKFETELVEF